MHLCLNWVVSCFKFEDSLRIVISYSSAKPTEKSYTYGGDAQSKSEAYVKFPEELFRHKNLEKQVCFVIISPHFSDSAYLGTAKSYNRTGVSFKLITTN